MTTPLNEKLPDSKVSDPHNSFFHDTRGDRGAGIYWNETNFATHAIFILIFLLSLLSNFIFAIIGALIAYFVWGPWMVDFAIEHHRNINWAYFYGTAFGLIGLLFYYVYVKLSRDPVIPDN